MLWMARSCVVVVVEYCRWNQESGRIEGVTTTTTTTMMTRLGSFYTWNEQRHGQTMDRGFVGFEWLSSMSTTTRSKLSYS